MLKVGITGGIGAGKSTVCRVFELLGVPVFYADEESKYLLNHVEVKSQIMKQFGSDILDAEQKIDRQKLAGIVFKDVDKLKCLNEIIHPAVGKRFEEWTAEHINAAFVLKEAAILFESGAYKQVDKVILVTAPLELRLQRIMKRDKTSEEEIRRRISNQMPEEEKLKLSEYQIHNNEEKMVIEQVLALHKLLKQTNNF